MNRELSEQEKEAISSLTDDDQVLFGSDIPDDGVLSVGVITKAVPILREIFRMDQNTKKAFFFGPDGTILLTIEENAVEGTGKRAGEVINEAWNLHENFGPAAVHVVGEIILRTQAMLAAQAIQEKITESIYDSMKAQVSEAAHERASNDGMPEAPTKRTLN